MFLESINIIETSPCLADKEKFKAITKASADLTEILPYINAELERPGYQENSQSLTFKRGIIGFLLMGEQISITKFVTITELHEILDWLKDMINDVDSRRNEITPSFEKKKIVPALSLLNSLPKKTGCSKCGEKTCMAFASKLKSLEAKVDDCPWLLEPEYLSKREKLIELLT